MKKIIDKYVFWNASKLAAAQRVAGEDLESVVAEYEKMGGKVDEVEEVAETKKVVKKTRAKKTTKKAENKTD